MKVRIIITVIVILAVASLLYLNDYRIYNSVSNLIEVDEINIVTSSYNNRKEEPIIMYSHMEKGELLEGATEVSEGEYSFTIDASEEKSLITVYDKDYIISNEILFNLLSKYECKKSRSGRSYFPYEADQIEVEISLTQNNHPKHILLGEFNIWYESGDEEVYDIINGNLLRDEIIALIKDFDENQALVTSEIINNVDIITGLYISGINIEYSPLMSSVPGLPIEINYEVTETNSNSDAFIHMQCSKGKFITWKNGIVKKIPDFIRMTESNAKVYWSPIEVGEEIASEPIDVTIEVYLDELMEVESCIAGDIIVNQEGFYTLVITGECNTASNNEMDLPADLSEEKIHELYSDATTMYSWFDISTLNVDMDKSVEVDGRLYGMVRGEWSDYDHLKSVLLLTFDKLVVERLLSSSLYKNIDGMLYSVPTEEQTYMLVKKFIK